VNLSGYHLVFKNDLYIPILNKLRDLFLNKNTNN